MTFFQPDESGEGGDWVELGKPVFDMDLHQWVVWESKNKARPATEEEIRIGRGLKAPEPEPERCGTARALVPEESRLVAYLELRIEGITAGDVQVHLWMDGEDKGITNLMSGDSQSIRILMPASALTRPDEHPLADAPVRSAVMAGGWNPPRVE